MILSTTQQAFCVRIISPIYTKLVSHTETYIICEVLVPTKRTRFLNSKVWTRVREFHRGSQCPTSETQSGHNKIHFMNFSKSPSQKTDLYLMMDRESKMSNTLALHKLPLVHITVSLLGSSKSQLCSTLTWQTGIAATELPLSVHLGLELAGCLCAAI
jgi:hypothetical protein